MMLATAVYSLAVTCAPPKSITLRTFSLATSKGESVFHEVFDRRRLSDTSERLALKFHAIKKQFEFEFQRSSVFAPNAIVRMIGHVRPGDWLCFAENIRVTRYG